jgi:hypothetical protein
MAQATQFEQPTQTYLTVSLSQASSIADQLFYIAPEPLEVVEIHEVHGTLGTDGSAVTATVKKCTGTQALTAGADLLGATKIDLKGTINTVQSPALTSTAADLQMAAGDRLSFDVTGTTTAVANMVVTVLLRRI